MIDARTSLPSDDPQYLTADQARDLKQQEIGDIPVPPKYRSSDFLSTGGARYWALRGKLDVPKERCVSFPHCEGPDGTANGGQKKWRQNRGEWAPPTAAEGDQEWIARRGA